jgi:protein-tyrosine phosphatase
VIDLHAHLLPGLDDGPATVEMALEMAAVSHAAGVRTVVATPHVDAQFGLSPDVVAPAAEEFRKALGDSGLEVRTGAEIAVGRLAELHDEDLELVRLGGGPALLIEAPLEPFAGPFEQGIIQVRRRGWEVVLAHPERCPTFHKEPDRLGALIQAGVRCSVTASAFSGRFGNTVRRFAARMLREELVHDIASDMHDLKRRPPGLAKPFAEAEVDVPGAEALTRWLTEEAPAAILAGDPLPKRPGLPAPRPSAKKRRWFRKG